MAGTQRLADSCLGNMASIFKGLNLITAEFGVVLRSHQRPKSATAGINGACLENNVVYPLGLPSYGFYNSE
jgi:hypothetical protein